MTEFFVRPIRKDELEDLLALYQHLNPMDPLLSINDALLAHWEMVINSPERHYLAGEADGKLVSSCNLSVIPNLTRNLQPYGLIENVVTHPDYRGRGYAGQLLRAALQIAWEANCYKVMLLTSRKDESVLRFYEKAGFLRGAKTGFVAYAPGYI